MVDSQIKIAHVWRRHHRLRMKKLKEEKAAAEKLAKEQRKAEELLRKQQEKRPRHSMANTMGMGRLGARTKAKAKQPKRDNKDIESQKDGSSEERTETPSQNRLKN